MSNEPRRNDPCPCGSGSKYKNCCQGKSPWHENKTIMGAGIALLLVIAVVLIGLAFSGGDSAQACPPGQVWSEAHGHCH